MSVFMEEAFRNHEQVVHCYDRETGLRAIIAIHDTTLGPALGGCRMWNYADEKSAVEDVLRLSRGMTYKSAAAGLNLGGGKAVIIGDSKKDKNEAFFRTYGRYIQSLAGRYITAEDVGTTVADMEWVRMETDYVTGISRALGGSGDPSPYTAMGCWMGMRASIKETMGKDSLAGQRVAIQGVGHVGYHLVKHVVQDGGKAVICDIDEGNLKQAVKDFSGVEVVGINDIYSVDCDIFAPCALGAVINDQTIGQLKCSIVAGSANNILKDEAVHATALQDRGILYAPDYVINAGGLINVANELEGYNPDKASQQTMGIYDITQAVFRIAKEDKCTTLTAADRLAERRIKSLGEVKSTYIGSTVDRLGASRR